MFEKNEKCSNIAVHIENVYRAWLRLWYYHIDRVSSFLKNFLSFRKIWRNFSRCVETSFVETEAILRYKNYRTAVDDIWYFLDLYTSFNDIAT